MHDQMQMGEMSGEGKTGWSPSKNPKIWGHLWQEVVRAGHCMMCGACVAACPVNVLYVGAKEEPVILGPCAACQVCYYSCPRLELPIDEIEQEIHGRTRTAEEDILGIHRGIYSTRALDEKLWNAGQDGGTSIALLAHALKIDLIDSFVTVGFAKSNSAFALGNGIPMKAVPVIGSSAQDIIDTAGSKYTHSGVLGGLSDAAASYPNGRIGLVALPCELQGLRRMHTSLRGNYKFSGPGVMGGRPVLTIGLFCSKVYCHEKIVDEFIQKIRGVDPFRVTRTVVKRARFKVYVGSECVIDVPIKEVNQYMSTPCSYCIDYTAELADISIGGIGPRDRWNIVIVRTETGQRLLDSAVKANVIDAEPISSSSADLAPLLKLASKKKQNNAYYLRRGIRQELLVHRLMSHQKPPS